MKVALLGTGTMGAGMARSLLRAGIDVTVWNRHSEKAKPLESDGATVAESVSDAVREADVVLTMLFDEAAVTEVAVEFLANTAPDAVWMQCATVGVAGVGRLQARAAEHGVSMVDAPVVGTKKPADEGTLVVLVSGEAASIRSLAPVLDAIGSKTVEVGDAPGSASALKLACNAWVASLTAATAQSVEMCRLLGVDPALFLHAIDGGPSNTPYAQLKGGMMIDDDFTASFAVDGLAKDLGLMLEAVQDARSGSEAPTEMLQALAGLFGRASSLGHGSDDIAAVVTAFRP
ncbi:NAD(P)-dependent oxidoreductase [Subtercola vilae]|uniref:NAD(P)-dependent oxidoreductase n=1 Tax=Subtercola vilae TaxID=2056433 RepID=A0A4T2C8W1_9MICO|nr:NAD(P)-dependent oxidoreductase [Subtercola vilae]TIH40082.1 NAD(P)-dependent oxidoreductase [Subtercola vilae]